MPDGYRLAWHDEFNGTRIGPDWAVERSAYGSGNNEMQCYRSANVRVSDGLLSLTARRRPNTCTDGREMAFTSGMVRSRNAWTYGRFEARVRVPEGGGMLPAVWMLSQNRPFGDRGRSGEIDIVEVNTADPSKVLSSMHWNHLGCGRGCSKQSTASELEASGSATDFHTYSVDWDARRITFRVDDRVVLRAGSNEHRSWASAADRPTPDSVPFPAPFSPPNRMYLLLNLAVGGNLVGEPSKATTFPKTMQVDYVRVYQRR